MSSTRSQPDVVVHLQPPLHVGVEGGAGEEVQDVEDGRERPDGAHQLDGLPDRRAALARAPVDEIRPRQDAVALGQIEGAAHVGLPNPLVQPPADRRRPALDAVADLDTARAAHPGEHLLVHRVHARDRRPGDVQAAADDAPAGLDHASPVEGEGVVAHVHEAPSARAQARHLLDEVGGRVRADPAAPEGGRTAEGAVGDAAAGQRQVSEVDVPRRHGQCVQLADGPRGGRAGRSAVAAQRQARERGRRRGVPALDALDQRREALLALAQDDVVDFREVREQVLPQVGRPHPAENGRDGRVHLFGDPRQLDPTPAVRVQDGKPDHPRAPGAQLARPALRRGIALVPVEGVHGMTARLQRGRHVVNPDRRVTDVLRVEAGVQKGRVDEQDLHAV